MIQRRYYFIHTIALIVLFAIDQITKIYVQGTIALGQYIEVIDSFFYFTYVQNTGAGFSLFENSSILFFGLITVVAIIGILFYYFKNKSILQRWILVAILAGALGNFYDRLVLGYVRDFIGVYIGGWAFPIFNVADILITCGCIGLIWLSIQEEKKEQ